MDAIRIEGLTKKYKDVVAVDNLSLTVKSGELFSLLGVNGAGKTTLIRIINQITVPDSGEVLFGGRPMREEDVENIGYLPEESDISFSYATGNIISEKVSGGIAGVSYGSLDSVYFKGFWYWRLAEVISLLAIIYYIFIVIFIYKFNFLKNNA